MQNTEPPNSAATPPDDTEVDAGEERPQVSSLRPATVRFSQRHLLNIASASLAIVVALALATHWLPTILPKPPAPPDMQKIHAQQTFSASVPLARGAGWKAIGPDWAQDISFTAKGDLGYVCGAYPPNPLVFVAVYDVHQSTWVQLQSPATGVICHISVSPTDVNDVVLVAYSCISCPGNSPISTVYRSLDGGATWLPLALPSLSPEIVTAVAWTTGSTGSTLYLVTERISTSGTTTSTSATYSLLVSRSDGPLTEISAQQLTGHPEQLGSIAIESSGMTLYASLTAASCTVPCTTYVRSSDDGGHWSLFTGTYRGNPIVLTAAVHNGSTLIGWIFLPQSSVTEILQSDDFGSSWRELPALPRDPETGGILTVVLPDDTIYTWVFGQANAVYALQGNATSWHTLAPLPAGTPLVVQNDAGGDAIALWGQAHDFSENPSPPGLEYYPLAASTAGTP
jgi:hypothetical protein